MIEFRTENGFPEDIFIETVEATKEGWEGYESTVTDIIEDVIDKFYHNDMDDRRMWVRGYFIGLENNAKEEEGPE